MNNKIKFVIVLFCTFLFTNCKSEKNSISYLIKSNNTSDVVKGYYLVGEYKKVEFIKDMFVNIDDQRISHHLQFKGISVFQAKIGALRKIYNIEPPRKLTYKYDAAIAEYYKDYSYKFGYLD